MGTMNDHDDRWQTGRLKLQLVPGRVPPLRAARRWIADTFARAGRSFVADVQLVVTELITNAYDHAGGATGIRLVYDPAAGQLLVEVDDASAGGPQRHEAQVRDVRGRGLLLVDSVTRVWGSRPAATGGKTVWALVQLPDAPAPAPAARDRSTQRGAQRGAQNSGGAPR